MFQNPMFDCYRPMQQYGQQLFPPQQPQVHCHFVTNIEEAKASLIDPMSMNLYLDSSNGKIYFKRINNNGQSEFLSYSVDGTNSKEDDVQQNNDALTNINSKLARIENFLGELKNAKSISDTQQSTVCTEQPATKTDATNGWTESPSVSENARNDKWKKR